MKNNFFFQINNQLFFGVGKTREIAQLVNLQNSQVIILVDDGVAIHSEYYVEIKRIIESFADSAIEFILRSTEEPSYDYLDEIAEQVRELENIDFIFAIGGGSTMDMGKAIAALITNPGTGINYRGF